MSTVRVRRCRRCGLTQYQVHSLACIAMNGRGDRRVPAGVERSLVTRGYIRSDRSTLEPEGWDALSKTEFLSVSFRSSLLKRRLL